MDRNRPDRITAEKAQLRDELHHLKSCQIKYFWGTVTATSAIIGIGRAIERGGGSPLLFLSPLIVILPCWLVFFDKATTITRIVGYVRCLEWMQENPTEPFDYFGWESSLRDMRNRGDRSGEDVPEKKQPWRARLRDWIRRTKDRLSSFCAGAVSGICAVVAFERKHRYWSLSWLIFFLLGLFCVLAVPLISHAPLDWGFYIALAVFLLACVQTLYVIDLLFNSDASYDHAENVWCAYMGIPTPRERRSQHSEEKKGPAAA